MNSLVPSSYTVRIVVDLKGLHGLQDPLGDLLKLFLLDRRLERINESWYHRFFKRAGTIAVICNGDRIVAKALLQCEVKTNGKIFGHIGHFSSVETFPRWQLVLIHALTGYAKGTVADLIIARNNKGNRFALKNEVTVLIPGITTAVT